MIAYRIQQPEHPLSLLLDPETQLSTPWNRNESLIRAGVSACEAVEELAAYFAQSGVALAADCYLVAMECEWADGKDIDADLGAILVIPTAIVSADLVPDSFFEAVSAAYDRIYDAA